MWTCYVDYVTQNKLFRSYMHLFVGRDVVIVIGASLPKRDWAVQGIIRSSSGCLLSRATMSNSATLLIYLPN